MILIEWLRRLLGFVRREREVQNVTAPSEHHTEQLKERMKTRMNEQQERVKVLEYQAAVRGRYDVPPESR